MKPVIILVVLDNPASYSRRDGICIARKRFGISGAGADFSIDDIEPIGNRCACKKLGVRCISTPMGKIVHNR